MLKICYLVASFRANINTLLTKNVRIELNCSCRSAGKNKSITEQEENAKNRSNFSQKSILD